MADPLVRAVALWNSAKDRSAGGDKAALAALRKLVEHLEKHDLAVRFYSALEPQRPAGGNVVDQVQAVVDDPKVRAAASAVGDLLGDILRRRAGK